MRRIGEKWVKEREKPSQHPDTACRMASLPVTAGLCLHLLVLSACWKAEFRGWKMLFMVWIFILELEICVLLLICSSGAVGGVGPSSNGKKVATVNRPVLGSVYQNMFGSCGILSPDMKQRFPTFHQPNFFSFSSWPCASEEGVFNHMPRTGWARHTLYFPHNRAL